MDYAYAIQQNLDDDAEVTVWTQGIFALTKTSVESLVKTLDKSDFAIFVFAPSDALRLRQKKYKAVRDNVIFELGLFMGEIGRERTFIVVPKGAADLRIPTDLAGITPGKFDPNRNDKNLEAAFGPFCNAVRSQVRRRGKRGRPSRIRASVDPRTVRDGDLLIIEGRYGYEDHRVDVTKQLNDAIVDKKLHIFVGNQLAGDPCPNVPKNVIVRYTYKNQILLRVVKEGNSLDLP